MFLLELEGDRDISCPKSEELAGAAFSDKAAGLLQEWPVLPEFIGTSQGVDPSNHR